MSLSEIDIYQRHNDRLALLPHDACATVPLYRKDGVAKIFRADVRGMCTVTDTVTIDMATVDFDDVQTLEGIVERAGGRREVRRRWPTVRDLEHRLPANVRDEAIVRQERGTPVLILDAGGVKVQA